MELYFKSSLCERRYNVEKRLCLSAIKLKYAELTNKEKLVADYIQKNSEKVNSMSVSELAKEAGVVKSVVIRCCKSLGFKGYSELKLSLTTELERNRQFNYTPYIDAGDTEKDILDKIFSANIKTLYDTMKNIDKGNIEKIVNAIYNAKNIYIYGIGTSAGVAADFQHRLMQFGVTAFCFTDIVSLKVSALNIKKGDVVIGISNSGRTMPVVDALDTAHTKGALTACVTSYPDCPLAKVCDIPVVIVTDEIQYPIEAISSRIAHISVLDAIVVSLSAKELDKAYEKSSIVHNAVNTIRYN